LACRRRQAGNFPAPEKIGILAEKPISLNSFGLDAQMAGVFFLSAGNVAVIFPPTSRFCRFF
jgi:hypothetical protein